MSCKLYLRYCTIKIFARASLPFTLFLTVARQWKSEIAFRRLTAEKSKLMAVVLASTSYPLGSTTFAAGHVHQTTRYFCGNAG